ncbi:hypothetical protein VTH8203_01525 [Vibrio thalassae]|uniref:Uncharacterized protein n=1 Tax=Vibrio thalassae TaxID=1243014 RepID=A0A240EJ00_9VIBR|nr:hypothetical protein [Vibrio thalassae]SNX47910.1 hypothetical protein VTH8203_01525 [Vibrio thalassae]
MTAPDLTGELFDQIESLPINGEEQEVVERFYIEGIALFCDTER